MREIIKIDQGPSTALLRDRFGEVIAINTWLEKGKFGKLAVSPKRLALRTWQGYEIKADNQAVLFMGLKSL